jgi:hypothetical protein
MAGIENIYGLVTLDPVGQDVILRAGCLPALLAG